MAEQLEEQEVKEVSYLEMSDEELMKMVAPTGNASREEEPEDEAPETPEAQESVPESTTETPESDPEEDQEETDDTESPDSTKEVVEPEETKQTPETLDTQVEPEKETSKEAPESTEVVDYKAEYEKVFKPFKANGREIAIKSAEDAIALMQMGANYNKKMAALKPNLQLMKLLEKNNLLDEGKLSYLIDLDKKNPDAINKLIKDSGIDPMDLDAEKASGYKPNTYTVDEREIELDTVLEEIQSTPTYTRTLEIVGNKWDGASKRVIAETPQLLKVINEHMSLGVYDIISAEVDRERTFGRLNGLSDIEAYKQVGDAIQARNGFAHLNQSRVPDPPAKPIVVTPKLKPEDDGKLRDKKRAASSTKPISANTVPKDFNPLALSDEEFAKLGNAKFL